MGVVKAENELKMKRMVFRVSRGTEIANFSDINQSAEYNTKRQEHRSGDPGVSVSYEPGVTVLVFSVIFKSCCASASR